MSALRQLAAALPAAAQDALRWPDARAEAWKYSSPRTLERLDLSRAPAAAASAVTTLEGFTTAVLDDAVMSVDAERFDWADAVRFEAAGQGLAELARRTAPVRAAVQLTEGQRVQLSLSAHAANWSGRVLVEVAPGASATLLLVDRSAITLANLLAQLRLGAGSTLELVRLYDAPQGSHTVEHCAVELAEGATLRCTTLDFSAGWAHRQLDVLLAGKAARAEVSGAVRVGGRAHADHQLQLLHRAPGVSSQTQWKALADGRARAVFDGLIEVAASAPGTDAHLKTASLLLSPHAEIDAKPELVIDTDAVACSHGASVGQLDERALFYLRSRGVPLAEARQLLCQAFLLAGIDGIADPLVAEWLLAQVKARLPDREA
ncbi:MAG: SufD family Fe-S cluster assembly protein [Xanthomonadales bacterium]|nr:SufD family Fe-S cluster assembly protein [Xanthomonadales bacterium]